MLAEAAAEEAAAAAALGVRRVGAIDDLRCLDEDLDASAERSGSRHVLWTGIHCCQHQEADNCWHIVKAAGGCK